WEAKKAMTNDTLSVRNASGIVSAVRAIKTRDEDWLGRLPFAENLGRAIMGWKENDSLILGLHGQWGSGKTSIKNLCLEFIETSSNGPIVLEFNPWHFTSEERLFDQFFNELEKKISEGLEDPDLKIALSSDLRSYSSLLKASSPLVPFIPLLLWLLNPTDPATLATATTSGALAKAGIDSGAAILDQVANVRKEEEDLKSKNNNTVEELKSSIQKKLLNMTRPVLVVIDDLDRLPPTAISLMVQLVKANADFPNMIYLLCFEREIVEKALENKNFSGRDYLEKIIQVSFDIPFVQTAKLQTKLTDEVRKCFLEIGLSWNEERWKQVFDTFKHLFKNPRQVYRYLNALSFHLQLFSRDNSFEVNSIDLASMEVFRLFAPAVHTQVYYARSQIFNIGIRYQLHKRDKSKIEELKAEVNKVFRLVENTDQESWCIDLFLQLFPFTAWLYKKNSRENFDKNDWNKDLRICDEVCFERYFLLSVPESDISQKALLKLVDSISEEALFIRELSLLNKQELLTPAISRLDANRSLIASTLGPNYVSGLLEMTEEAERFDLAIWTIERYLLQFKTIKIRDEIMIAACTKTKALASLIFLIRNATAKSEENETSIITQGAAKKLRNLAAKRLKNAVDCAILAPKHPAYATLIYSWSLWSSKRTIQKAVVKVMRNEQGFWEVLESLFQSIVEKMPPDELLNVTLASDAQWLKEWMNSFTNISLVKSRLAKYKTSTKLSEKQKNLIRCAEAVI
ncbi:MAG: KAP family NTPase, partial [Candidatus Obscuribacterales bacterium]|nr:KAP family NTPase [Candidatus Obscuribacterales bacterium]